MTAPDMVNVIAAALVTHWAETIASEGDGFYVECRCGEIGHVESDAEDWEPANQWLAAHQARAVLAAISEAGAVEWGSEHVAQVGLGVDFHDWSDEETARRKVAHYGGTVVSRITGPWTAAADHG